MFIFNIFPQGESKIIPPPHWGYNSEIIYPCHISKKAYFFKILFLIGTFGIVKNLSSFHSNSYKSAKFFFYFGIEVYLNNISTCSKQLSDADISSVMNSSNVVFPCIIQKTNKNFLKILKLKQCFGQTYLHISIFPLSIFIYILHGYKINPG